MSMTRSTVETWLQLRKLDHRLMGVIEHAVHQIQVQGEDELIVGPVWIASTSRSGGGRIHGPFNKPSNSAPLLGSKRNGLVLPGIRRTIRASENLASSANRAFDTG